MVANEPTGAAHVRLRDTEVVTGGDQTSWNAAIADIADGLHAWPLWVTLGWRDIQNRYRRSVLGPFWLTLSLAILVLSLGTLYALLLGRPIEIYMPHVGLGFIFWQLISSSVSDGCNTFITAEKFLKQIRLPFSVHVYRTIWRNLIIMAHNLVVYVGIAVVFSINPFGTFLLVIPGLILLSLTAAWVALLLGLVCARFRDVPNIINSIIRIGFFLTPIIWMPDMMSKKAQLVELNPFYHYLEIVRAPLLGNVPDPQNWLVAFVITVVGWVITLMFFARYRQRIPYWL